jgi:hypothetical protein
MLGNQTYLTVFCSDTLILTLSVYVTWKTAPLSAFAKSQTIYSTKGHGVLVLVH